MIPSTPPSGSTSFDRTHSALPQGSLRRRLIAAAIALVCLGGLAFSVDLDVARWCKAGHIPKEIMRFLNFSEVCGHGIGVASILLAAAVLDPTLAGRRAATRLGSLPISRDLVRMLAATFIASHSDINSFPSGHAATAAGLAAALSWKYPHGTWLFFLLAASAAAQRVASSAHYPSDVFMGAALGLASAAVILGQHRPQANAVRPHLM